MRAEEEEVRHGRPDARALVGVSSRRQGRPPGWTSPSSQDAEDQLVFRALEEDAESFEWREGESFPIDESYCEAGARREHPRGAGPRPRRARTPEDLGDHRGGHSLPRCPWCSPTGAFTALCAA